MDDYGSLSRHHDKVLTEWQNQVTTRVPSILSKLSKLFQLRREFKGALAFVRFVQKKRTL
jgi:hypothetical protein